MVKDVSVQAGLLTAQGLYLAPLISKGGRVHRVRVTDFAQASFAFTQSGFCRRLVRGRRGQVAHLIRVMF